MTQKQRIQELIQHLSDKDKLVLQGTITDDLALANVLVENAVGYFNLPFSLVPGIEINRKTYPIIPLVTEETSVVAALSKTVRFIQKNGKITAYQKGCSYLGQIHFPHLKSKARFKTQFEKLAPLLIQKGNEGPCSGMVKRGGGITDIQLRFLRSKNTGVVGIIHVLIDTKDAMGANLINQTCEYLAPFIEKETGQEALMSIVSNFNTEKITQVRLTLKGISPELGNKIALASSIAQYDTYRATTHNKGVMNGIDALCLATGNDWRALEAGVHAYACKSGQYRGVCHWYRSADHLHGIFEAPLNVGIIGGVTHLHPVAQLGMRCLGIQTAQELSYLMGAVGLMQNFAALKVLVSEGISRGHMRLHFKNLIEHTDATLEERALLLCNLNRVFDQKGFVTTEDIHTLLKGIRQ